MPKLTPAARQARIQLLKATVLTRLAHRVIDVSQPAFSDLYADGNPAKQMATLNGVIILERDLYPDGRLRGVVSIDADDLAAALPDIKADTQDKTGWKRHLDKFAAEGVDLLAGVPDPQASEYDTGAIEDVLAVNPAALTDAQGKAKLVAIQDKAKAGNV